MKTIYRFFIATFAAAVALASCSKEMIKPDAESESGCENDSVRVITVSYVATKAYFYPDELTPQFSEDDVIRVSNGSKIEDCTVIKKSGVCLITTKLPGRLTAVFPASAAITSGTEITGVKTSVKDNQGNGRNVMDHISAIATIEPTATSATFEIQQAIFFFNIWEGCEFLYINSLNTIENGRRTTGEKVSIATTESGDPAYSITIIGGTIKYNTCAVIQPGVNLSDLSFDIKSDSYGHKMKGIPLSVIGERDNQTVANGFYTIDDQNWHDYVIYRSLKYAKMNIGATAETGPNSYGEYFMWGDVHGYKPSGSGFAFPSANPDPGYRFPGSIWDGTQGFAQCNEPFYKGGTSSMIYTKYNSSGRLELKDDAAYANWGGAWRMPTDDELGYLARSSSTEKGWDDTSKCFLFNKSDNKNTLYFPAAGTGSGLNEPAVGSKGSYWSSDLSSTWSSSGLRLLFESNGSNVVVNNTQQLNRYLGSPIRPVADL